MFKQRLIVAGVAGALGLMVAAGAWAGPVSNKAIEVVGVGAAADPLIAVEANRGAIVDRIAAEHADVLATMGAGASAAFRAALAGLRADQLLAASLVGTVTEVNAIIVGQGGDGTQLQRFVALAPVATTGTLPSAQAYLVRNADTLTIVRSADLAAAGGQVVGYFVPTATSSGGPIGQNDGSGSGANSWIGYVAGSNVASGAGSAVAAGTFNAATNTNAAVFAGQSNQANGISSLVIGGFDNRATAIDSLVGAGAGHRATGARSVIVGGGYNLASGQWSFIGGGGRDGTGSTAAGTNALDNVASGNFSAVVGGHANRATATDAFVGGGYNNTASGIGATVAGGGYSPLGSTYPNVASATLATISGGLKNTASGTQSTIGGGYLNVASGLNSAVPGGFNNTAAGEGSFAAGYRANAAHPGSFVWSDQQGGIASTGDDQFVVRATGGMSLASPRGIALDASDNPIITRGWDAFDGTAPANKTGLGRWGLFMESSALTIGMPNVAGRTVQVAAYNVNGAASPLVVVDQSGMISQPFAFGQNLTFAGANKGIGSQANAVYTRAGVGMYWYAGGVHSDTTGDAGGGSVLASLTSGASASTVTGTFRAQTITATSDRNQKTAFAPVDAKAVLAKVNALPITTWSFKNEADAGVRHIGPMSQDFKQVFEVGADDRSITTVDAGGVALAAIQGLSAELKERDATIATIAAQAARIEALQRQVTELVAAQDDVKVMKAAQAARIEALQRQVTELVAAQDDVKVMKAALAELVREHAAVGVQVRLPLSH